MTPPLTICHLTPTREKDHVTLLAQAKAQQVIVKKKKKTEKPLQTPTKNVTKELIPHMQNLFQKNPTKTGN